MAITANRGEVWQVELPYPDKVRPALLLSVEPGDLDRDLVTIVPRTTSLRGSRFEVNIPLRGFDPGAFNAQNLMTISRAKLLRRRAVLTSDQLSLVEQVVRAWLGL